MIIPVRCFSCGKVVGDKWDAYLALLIEGRTEGEALTELGLQRYCCRRMVLTHVDLIERLLHYNIHERKSNPFPAAGASKTARDARCIDGRTAATSAAPTSLPDVTTLSPV
ncbi:DNA-directed RNA Polymerase II subunit L [Malassezia japonica]|uniref:DNA-directed RNA polymerases I, II, and III subunit RPABC5 n=1 Tax=Malassezia japonica TaxID=223818 RepID=A0AAF0F308_9BASI|nr:DNA-directed RNA Polymerase II subunit L [Malassezia japonica]WFD39489.1 DNA-directed RNA Polymerase II subunit L [Malassezia japonica]